MANILFVDDSKSIRDLANFSLSSAGHNVTVAEDGVKGLVEASNTDYDLVVTDINMPLMDGFRLINELRKTPSYRTRPILVLTTETAEEKKQKGKFTGATGWITKPFDPEKLNKLVSRVVN